MAFYRVRQFYKAITSKITKDDKKYVKKYLNEKEIELFSKLSKSEKKHCIYVARSLEKKCNNEKINIDKNFMIKVGLLHDIGKILIRLSVIDKAILVILNSISKGKIKKFNNIKKIEAYYNHGEKGYNILKAYGYDEKFLFLIKNHHKNFENVNIELELLKQSDDEN